MVGAHTWKNQNLNPCPKNVVNKQIAEKKKVDGGEKTQKIVLTMLEKFAKEQDREMNTHLPCCWKIRWIWYSKRWITREKMLWGWERRLKSLMAKLSKQLGCCQREDLLPNRCVGIIEERIRLVRYDSHDWHVSVCYCLSLTCYFSIISSRQQFSLLISPYRNTTVAHNYWY